jgi:NAD/NADP transhydrogenase beta subunit
VVKLIHKVAIRFCRLPVAGMPILEAYTAKTVIVN